MKWFFIAILAALCVAIGVFFSLKYKKRESFFHSLVLLAQKLDVEISFSRERLSRLLEGLDESIKTPLCGVDKKYLGYLAGSADELDDKIFSGAQFLRQDEKDMILLFFKTLGRSDVESQSKEIRLFSERFNQAKAKASEERKKYGSLSLKLGVIGALFVAVLLY